MTLLKISIMLACLRNLDHSHNGLGYTEVYQSFVSTPPTYGDGRG